MKKFYDFNIKSKFNDSEGKCDVLEAQNSDEPVKEECDVSDKEDSDLYRNEEIDETKHDVIENTNIFHSEKHGISTFFQHCDLNTKVESKHSGFGIESGCVERINEQSDVSEDDIEDSKCFIQQYLEEEKFQDSIDTSSSKKIGTIECSESKRLVESVLFQIGIQPGFDEIINRETNMSEAEDNKCFIHQYLDEKGKLCNNIDTISLKKEGVSGELHENEFLEDEDRKVNTCEGYLEECSAPRRNNLDSNGSDILHKCSMCEYITGSNLQLHIDSVHLKVERVKNHNCPLCDYSAVSNDTLKRHFNRVHLHKCHLNSDACEDHVGSTHGGLKEYKCNICDYSASTKSTLKRHIDSVHLGVKKYKCHLCDYSATRGGDLKRHIDSLHLKLKTEKKHKCHLCYFCTTSRSKLKYHIEGVHLKVKREKKRKCHLCDYITDRNFNLKCHINGVHLKAKKHKCHLCDYCTANSCNLNRHIDRVHLEVKKHKCHTVWIHNDTSSIIQT